jgi:uncharacterized ion transporter superfamily protein YfcC
MRFPHPLVLLVLFALVAAAASYVLPAGEYERRDDADTGRKVVVGGTYHRVAAQPVSAFDAVVAIPKGAADAASVIFFVFLVGGAFAVVEQTGALTRAVNWLVHRLQNREALVIPIACVAFGTAGALMQMAEELLAFSPIDPFMVGIAQQVAGLPLLSGAAFRIIFLVVALAFWIFATTRYAQRTRTTPETTMVSDAEAVDGRRAAVLMLVLITFVLFVVGVLRFGWGFDELAALFFLMGVFAGLLGGLRVNGTAEAFVEGFRAMAFAAMIIGFARAIYLILEQGRIIDTIVHGLFVPVQGLPPMLSAIGMMGAQILIHFPVPSTSGQAVLTLPVLVPLSDLIGLSRQVTVLAYQYGAGLCELVTPTNGALMAMLAATRVSYGDWIKFFAVRGGALLLVAVIAIVTAVAIGLQ